MPLLVAQGVMGGIDTLVNHEWVARLPRRAEARGEIALHTLREAIYGSLFLGLAWREWHGALAFAILALLAAEIAVTTVDEFIENRTRVLPQNERVLHVLLTLNLGLIVAMAVFVSLEWSRETTALVPVDHGWLSWALTALGAAAWAWSVRDAFAWIRLGRARAVAL